MLEATKKAMSDSTQALLSGIGDIFKSALPLLSNSASATAPPPFLPQPSTYPPQQQPPPASTFPVNRPSTPQTPPLSAIQLPASTYQTPSHQMQPQTASPSPQAQCEPSTFTSTQPFAPFSPQLQQNYVNEPDPNFAALTNVRRTHRSPAHTMQFLESLHSAELD
jgi:hypothetical protein